MIGFCVPVLSVSWSCKICLLHISHSGELSKTEPAMDSVGDYEGVTKDSICIIALAATRPGQKTCCKNNDMSRWGIRGNLQCVAA